MERTIKITTNEIIELPDSDAVSIIASPNIEATIIDNDSKRKSIKLVAGENSKINFVSLQKGTKQKTKRNAETKNNAVINWLDCHVGNESYDCETTNLLTGDNSVANNFCLFFGTGVQNFDYKISSIHEGRNTSSDILARGVLNDESKAVCRGLLQINKSASNSSSYQKSEILLLDNRAKADCTPELNINCKEVKKCGHAAAITQIDSEKLFYLMSRGLSKKDAINVIVGGFLASALKKADIDNYSQKLRELIKSKLELK